MRFELLPRPSSDVSRCCNSTTLAGDHCSPREKKSRAPLLAKTGVAYLPRVRITTNAVARKSEWPDDSRTSLRFTLHFFVRFRWRDNTRLHFGEGITRDVSSKGLFIVTETLPDVRSVIRCWFYMPTKEQLLFRHSYKVTTVALVLRVCTDVFSSGFAASARAMSLTACEDSSIRDGFSSRQFQQRRHLTNPTNNP